MATAAEMIDETLSLLMSSQDQPQVTVLQAPIASTDLSLTVGPLSVPGMGISPGVLEIEQELLFAQSTGADGTVVIAPFGRGYRSTKAAAHAAGVAVTTNPPFPRSRVMTAMNECISRIFPEVYAVKVANLTTTVPRITYDLPEDAQWVLDARWLPPAAVNSWLQVRRLRWSNGTGTGDTGNVGISVDVDQYMMPGRPIEFTYAAAPAPFTAESDVFGTVTGLGDGLRDVVVYGAAASLLPSLEAAKLRVTATEQQDRNRLVTAGSALSTASYVEKHYQQRLMEERQTLQVKYPPRILRTWM